MNNIESEKKTMPAIKSAGNPSKKSKSKERTVSSAKESTNQSKQTQKSEWKTHFAYLNDKKREKLMELPDIPQPDKKKKRRKYVDRRIRVDKLDVVKLNEDEKDKKKASKEVRSRSRSMSSSSSSSNRKAKNNKTSSESSSEEEITTKKTKQKESKKLLRRDSSGSVVAKKRSTSAIGNEHQLKKVSEYKKENSGYPFHFEAKDKKDDKKAIQFNPSRYNKPNYNEEELEEIKELNKSYRDSRKEVLSRRAKLDLDKMNIDYDLNYDLINAFNELEVRPVYKNLLRSIRSNL